MAVPKSLGGAGGNLADLFNAVAKTPRHSRAEAQILAVQRQFAEVLLTSGNIGHAEYRLRDILDGSISGACTATWPVHARAPLSARETGVPWLVAGDTSPVPNVGEAWFLITALVQPVPRSAPFLAILRSEDDGIVREPASSDVTGDETTTITARSVFFRADEILQQDALQILDHLRRFSQFLRCAVVAVEAEQALESVETSAGTDAGAELRRVVARLIRPVMRSGRFPSTEDLRVASRTLGALRPQSASVCCGGARLVLAQIATLWIVSIDSLEIPKMMDWIVLTVFVTFKLLVFGTGMFFAIKWHRDREKEEKEKKKKKNETRGP